MKRRIARGLFCGIAAAVAATLSTVTAAAAERRPNILLLYSDQHNASVLGCEGHPDVKTPHLDGLAEAGVRFSRVYCQNGICVPSRVSMMTGQYCRTTGILTNTRNAPHVLDELNALHRVLGHGGYHTACFGKRHLTKGLEDGFDESCTTINPKLDPSDENYLAWIEKRGQRDSHLRDFGGSHEVPLMSRISTTKEADRTTAYVADKTIDLIRRAKRLGKPFFCWTSFIYPHQPYTPLEKWATRYDPAKIALPVSIGEPADKLPPQLQRWRRNEKPPWCGALAAKDEMIYRRFIAYYYALVSEIDHWTGRILAALEEEGLADDTIVVYTSDHGDFVGGHGMWEKCALGHNVYEETLRVPLILRYPGRFRAGTTRRDLVELIDLYPTLLELAGIKPPGKGYALPGRSLVPTLTRGEPVGRTYAISENWSQVAVITEDAKLGVWIEPPAKRFDYRVFGDMLFDLKSDPHELKNLAASPEAAGTKRRLMSYLAEWEKRTPKEGKEREAPRAFPEPKKKPDKKPPR